MIERVREYCRYRRCVRACVSEEQRVCLAVFFLGCVLRGGAGSAGIEVRSAGSAGSVVRVKSRSAESSQGSRGR